MNAEAIVRQGGVERGKGGLGFEWEPVIGRSLD